jgi:AraC-type transcriptional regulator N-terminus
MHQGDITETSESSIRGLARAIARYVHRTGDLQTALPALSLHRRDRPTEPLECTYPLSLAITVQGEKQVMVGDRILDYRAGQSLVTDG